MNLNKIEKVTGDFKSKNKDLINGLKSQSAKLTSVCRKLDNSWSKSSLGYHAYYYYKNFSTPPPEAMWSKEWGAINGVPEGWESRTGDEVKKEIENSSGVNIREFSEKYEKLLILAENLKKEVQIEVSDFEFDQKTIKEKEICETIEKFNSGISC